jgi:polysaccharide biosynthesis protein PelC
MSFSHYILVGMLLLLLAGCVIQPPYGQQLHSLPPGPLCRVAILPFQNESDYPLANALVAKVFAAELEAGSNYLLAQEGDVRKIYQQLRILPGRAATPEQMQILANRLGAQLLITGNVIEMREAPGNNAAVNPVLGLEVRIYDGASAVSLWHTYHRRQGTDYRTAMHFGTIHTATGLSQQVSREIINLWFKEGLTQCDVSPRF